MHDICKILPKLPALGSLKVQWPQINVVELPTSAHNSLVRLCATYFRRASPAQPRQHGLRWPEIFWNPQVRFLCQSNTESLLAGTV